MVWLAAVVAVACQGPAPVPASATVPTPPSTETVRLFAQASVLVIGDPGDIRTITSIRVEPSKLVADVGATVSLSALVLDGSGRPLDDATLVWSVSDPRAGRIDDDGLFTTGADPGEFRDAVTVIAVRNSAQGIQSLSMSIDVTVVGDPVVRRLDSITVFPELTTLTTDQVYRMRAAAFDENGLLIPAVNLVWSVDVPVLGRVSQLGYLTVLGPEGTYENAVTVTAVWEGETLTRTIDVSIVALAGSDEFLAVHALPETFRLQAGDQLQLTAVALDARGEVEQAAQIRWSMVNPAAGSIEGDGLFTAGSAASVFTEAIRVEAVLPGESGILRAENFVNVVVVGREPVRPLAAIRVVPNEATAPAGFSLVMIAQGFDEAGAPAVGTMFTWEVVDPAVGEIDEAGSLVLTRTPGFYARALKVTAVQNPDGGSEHDGVTITRLVDVTVTGRLTLVTIEPDTADVVPGRTIHFAVSAEDELGNPLTGLAVLWSVTDPSAGTIDTFGNFTASGSVGIYEDSIVAEVIQTLTLPD